MTEPPVTYGQLMDDARRAAHQGMNALARDRLPDAGAAREAVTARGTLLASLARQATTLIGAPRLEAWRASTPHRHAPEPARPPCSPRSPGSTPSTGTQPA